MQRLDMVKMAVTSHGDAIRAAARGPLTDDQVEQIIVEAVDGFLDSVGLTLACQEPVTIYGFGRFTPRDRKAVIKSHPTTGEPLPVPERTTVGFVPAGPLKKRVNGDR